MSRRKPVKLNEHNETVDKIKEDMKREKKLIRRNKRRRFQKRLLIVILIGLFIYGLVLFDKSDYSRYQTIKVSGNQFYSKNDIIEVSKVSPGSRMINNLPFMINKRVKKLPLVENADVNVYYNKGYLSIDVTEVKPVAYSQEETIQLYFSNGEIVDADESSFSMIADLPLLNGFTPEKIHPELLLQLSKLPDEAFLAISEIYLTPKEFDETAMKMVMNDEYFVYLSIETLPMLKQYATLVEGAEEFNKCIDMIEYGPNESSQTAIIRRCD